MLLHKFMCKGGREGGNKKREGEGIEGEREREREREGEGGKRGKRGCFSSVLRVLVGLLLVWGEFRAPGGILGSPIASGNSRDSRGNSRDSGGNSREVPPHIIERQL